MAKQTGQRFHVTHQNLTFVDPEKGKVQQGTTIKLVESRVPYDKVLHNIYRPVNQQDNPAYDIRVRMDATADKQLTLVPE
jgi:hypothetical protein